MTNFTIKNQELRRLLDAVKQESIDEQMTAEEAIERFEELFYNKVTFAHDYNEDANLEYAVEPEIGRAIKQLLTNMSINRLVGYLKALNEISGLPHQKIEASLK